MVKKIVATKTSKRSKFFVLKFDDVGIWFWWETLLTLIICIIEVL